MDHFYDSIKGFFTFPDFYSHVAEEMTKRASPHLVELGVYGGTSAAYLGVELINRNVFARLDLVDLFHGGAQQVIAALDPIRSVLGAVRSECSWEAARHYEDLSLDMVFIDADHSYESVRNDIAAWLPKVRLGGILAGHDFTPLMPGVVDAVQERFERFEIWRGVKYKQHDPGMQDLYWPVWSVRC
jgi:predicted O-methyltransferase YrrM